MVKDIDRSEQQILGGVLVKNLKELIKARHDEKNEGTIKKYSDIAPGPNAKKSVKIEKTRFGLRVYGKGPNRNKLVVHTIYSLENCSNSPKEQVPLDEAWYLHVWLLQEDSNFFALPFLHCKGFLGFNCIKTEQLCGSHNHERSRHPIFLDHLSVGNAYEINKFRVVHNRRSSKVILHAAMIELNKNITIVPIHKTSQELPMHWFNLIELDQLYQRINNDVELTDVFGCLTAVQPTEEITIQKTRVAKKRNLSLKNIKDESVRITLWGEIATNFENSGIQSLLPPVFVALTSLKEILFSEAHDQPFVFSIRRFRNSPNTNTTEMYKGCAVDANAESKTIDQLLLLDPALHKNTSFVCQATIVGFDLTRGWWYKSCPSCHKVVKNNSRSLVLAQNLRLAFSAP
ncbi:hypothetical protein DVH24_030587 [Malus domestica]|uniref:Replication protein A OB domain-containing protein n=1 Tax=Malus domestica TaxID=3750 RepID=A0A498JYD7_MALDO|nr:hypothetical protein DVH24_030587 [Malus domestica]